VPEYRDLPERDASLLKSACRLPEEAAVPVSVIAAYWDFKHVWDRLSKSPVPLSDLCRMAMLAGFGQAPDPKEPGDVVLELVQNGEVQFDAPVSAMFRNKWRPGVYRGISADSKTILVVFDGDADERKIPIDRVKVLEPELVG
jgi:hypothetical protein